MQAQRTGFTVLGTAYCNWATELTQPPSKQCVKGKELFKFSEPREEKSNSGPNAVLVHICSCKMKRSTLSS